MSETYTAVYERDGEAWVAEIAEEPRVRTWGPTLAKAREDIRAALALWLTTDPGELHIVDDFRLPAQVREAQKAVKETRTDLERAEMMTTMTDPISALNWAKDLGLSMRDPATVEWLAGLEGVKVGLDELCHTITVVEDMSRSETT